MVWLEELGSALGVAGRLLRQRHFWRELARASRHPALLLVLAGIALLYLGVDFQLVPKVGQERLQTALLAAWGWLPPLLMLAWCPAIARATCRAMQLDLPEAGQPAWWRFVGWWLLVLLVLGASLVAPLLFSRSGIWLALAPMALMLGWYHLRAALCVHANPQSARSVLRATWLRRTVLWLPMTATLQFLAAMACVALKDSLGLSGVAARLANIGVIALQLPLAAAVLAWWAALALRALHRLQAPMEHQPPVRQLRLLPGWKTAALAVLLVAAAGAYAGRLRLVDAYLAWTDKEYAADNAGIARASSFAQRMELVVCHAAMKGRLGRIELLHKSGWNPDREALGVALGCAVRQNQVQVAEYLVGRGAPVDGTSSMTGAVWPLWQAVRDGNRDMADWLLRQGASPNLPGRESLLNDAARRQDVAMLRLLHEAGAKPGAKGRHPAFLFVEAARSRGEGAAPGWPTVIAGMEQAGLPLDALDADGGNLLHWAAGRGEFGLLANLLKRGLDPRQPDRNGEVPYQRLAAWYKQADVEPGPELELALALLGDGVAGFEAQGGRLALRGQGRQ